MQLSKSFVIRSSLCLFLWAAVLQAQPGSVPYVAINQAEIDGQIWAIPGDGTTDATAKLQAAVSYAVAHQRTLLLRSPTTAYKITDTITVGTGTAVILGLDIMGVGMPRILWAGAGAKPMFDVVSLSESRLTNLWLDGNNVANVTGMRVRAVAPFPSQGLQFTGLFVEKCPVYGIQLTQPTTVDYMMFDSCTVAHNGIGLRIQEDLRAVDWRGGRIAYSTTYGVDVESGVFHCWDATFLQNGSGSIYLGSNLAAVSIHASNHEDHPVLTGGGTWNTYSPVATASCFIGCYQNMYTLPFPAGPAIDWNGYKCLTLVGCSFVQSVNIGADALNVENVNTEFIPFAYSGIAADFTGHTEKVGQLGRGTDGLPDLFIGPFRGQLGDAGFDRPILLEFDGSWDNESWPLPIQIPRVGAMTLLAVDAYAVGSSTPTLRFDLEIRGEGTINTAGTDVWTIPVTATAAGLHSTVFDASSLPAGCHLWWKTGSAAATGTVDAIKLVIKAR